MAQNYVTFRKYVTIFLSGMTGLMISYPLALDYIGSPLLSVLILLTSFAAGSMIGYRRRNSGIFLYFCMLAVIILAVVISSSLNVN